MAYFSIEPFGEERADLRMATIACLIANANRDEKKRREPYTVQDFMPRFDPNPGAIDPHPGPLPDGERERRQTWEQQKAMMMALMPPKK